MKNKLIISDEVAGGLFKAINIVSRRLKAHNELLYVVAEREDHYIVTLKFPRTHKRLRFYLSKEATVESIEMHRLEKTSCIARDIANMYTPKHSSWLEKTDLLNGIFPDLLEQFTECLVKSSVDENAARATGVLITDSLDMSKYPIDTTLFLGIIKEAKLDNTGSDNFTTFVVSIVDSDVTFEVTISNGLEHLLCANRIFVINRLGGFNTFTIQQLSRHISLNQRDMSYLKNKLRRFLYD